MWRITGRAFHRARPDCEFAMHDRKIQGMKLATAPLLRDPSPWTSFTPCCVFPPFCFTSHCNQPSRKMQIIPINMGQRSRVKDTYSVIFGTIICKYFGRTFINV